MGEILAARYRGRYQIWYRRYIGQYRHIVCVELAAALQADRVQHAVPCNASRYIVEAAAFAVAAHVHLAPLGVWHIGHAFRSVLNQAKQFGREHFDVFSSMKANGSSCSCSSRNVSVSTDRRRTSERDSDADGEAGSVLTHFGDCDSRHPSCDSDTHAHAARVLFGVRVVRGLDIRLD